MCITNAVPTTLRPVAIVHADGTRASHTQMRLPTSRSCTPPFFYLLRKHGKAGINCSASDSTWQSVSAIAQKQKSTTDRFQNGGLSQSV